MGTPSHLGHMDRVAATMPSQAHAGAAQEAPDIAQWEGHDVPLVRPSSCNVKGGIPSSRRYLPTYLPHDLFPPLPGRGAGTAPLRSPAAAGARPGGRPGGRAAPAVAGRGQRVSGGPVRATWLAIVLPLPAAWLGNQPVLPRGARGTYGAGKGTPPPPPQRRASGRRVPAPAAREAGASALSQWLGRARPASLAPPAPERHRSSDGGRPAGRAGERTSPRCLPHPTG